jgi:hypothetical protein
MMKRQSTQHAEGGEPLHREHAQDAQGAAECGEKEEMGLLLLWVMHV